MKVQQRLPVKQLSFVAIIVVAAVAMGAVVVQALGGAGGFRAGVPGLNDPAAQSVTTQGSTSIKHGDVTLSVVAFLADGIQTAVELEFDGLPGGWAAVPGAEGAFLEDGDGNRLKMVQAGVDANSAHATTLIFEPLRDTKDSLQLVIPSLIGKDLGNAGNPAPFLYAGEWTVAVPFETVDVPPNRLATVVAEESFGPGRIVVESVTIAPSGVLVEGHLAGFTREDVIATVLVPASLGNQAGGVVGLAGGQQGNSESATDFALQFPPIEGDSLDLQVSLNKAAGRDLPDHMQDYVGQSVSVRLNLN